MTKLLGVGDVVAVLAQPGSGERYWLAVSSTNVWQGYNPDALDIPAVMLQPTSRPVKDSLVFIEDVSGLFSLRSVICDSVQLKQGPDRGHYLLPVIEEDRIITAMTAWENKNENDEDDGDDDDNDGEDKDDDKKRKKKRKKKRSEKSWGLKKRRKQKEEEEGEEKGRLWDVSQIIGQRDGAEGREYLLEWEETLEPACRIVEGGRMCDLADDARLVGRQGGEFIDEHHYIHPEVLVIRKVKHLTRDRRRLAVRWRPTWTNELQCPATEVLQWRLQHQQGEEEAQEEETHEFEMQNGGIDTHPVAASSPTSSAAPIATATLAPQPTVTTTVASIVPLLQSYTTTAAAAAAVPAAAVPAAAAPALSWRDIARTALANEGAMATLDEILASADPRKLAQTKNPKRRICEALKALGATSSRTRDRTTWALPPSSHQAQG